MFRQEIPLHTQRKRRRLGFASKLEKLNISPEEFRQLRDSLGYTQVEFAQLLGVSRPAIARAEAKGPSPVVCAKLEVVRLKGLLVRKGTKSP